MKKFNVVDAGIILLIIALLVVAYLKFSVHEQTMTDVSMDKIVYSMKISGVRNYAVDAFKVGDTLYDTQTKLVIGIITQVETMNTKTNEGTSDGRLIYVENPERYDVVITIETNGIENEKAFFADRSVELKVGSEKVIETKYVKTTGVIMSVENKGE